MINFITSEAQRKVFEDIDLLHKCHNSLTRVHRAKQSLQFLETCLRKRVFPKFITFSVSIIKKTCLTKLEIRNFQSRNLIKERNKMISQITAFEHNFNRSEHKPVLRREQQTFEKACFRYFPKSLGMFGLSV